VINATLANHRSTPISLVELDYPSASFGVQQLAPGEEFRYRFKVIGAGSTSVLWNEGGRDQKKSTGPELREGDAGTLNVTFTSDAKPTWDVRLTNRPAK
jgi:hypothetical protein